MINNFNINNFHLWTALITPFDQNGLVDYATLNTLVAEQEAANNGILLLGSTGEGLALTLKEQQATVELGSQEKIDLSAALDDAQSILSYLNHKQVFADAPYKPKVMTRYGCQLNDYIAYYAPMGGMVEYLAPLGGHIKAGEPIAKILRMERYLSEQPLQTLSFDLDAIAILHFASASVNQGTELYKFFTNVFEL